MPKFSEDMYSIVDARTQGVERFRSRGVATQGMDRADGGYFDCELISHVEGNLWQGGCIDGVRLTDDFKYVVSLYPWEKYELPEGCERTEVKMYDALDQDTGEVDKIAAFVNACAEKGKTLVHCQAGLNRSGLIAARALMLQGKTADEAISLLRKTRSPMVLCNQAFEDWLRSL